MATGVSTPSKKVKDTEHLVLFEGLASGCRIITTQLSGFEDEQAEKIASGYTWSHILKKTRTVYQEVVGHKFLTTSKGKYP